MYRLVEKSFTLSQNNLKLSNHANFWKLIPRNKLSQRHVSLIHNSTNCWSITNDILITRLVIFTIKFFFLSNSIQDYRIYIVLCTSASIQLIKKRKEKTSATIRTNITNFQSNQMIIQIKSAYWNFFGNQLHGCQIGKLIVILGQIKSHGTIIINIKVFVFCIVIRTLCMIAAWDRI